MASRQLVCLTCLPGLERISKLPHIVDAGETVRFVRGTSRAAYVCDDCGTDLGEGKPCVAVTILSRGQSLGPWEHNYLKPDVAAGVAP